MKCPTCKSDYYPLAHETYYDMGVKYHAYICPYCDSEHFTLLKSVGIGIKLL
jgi:Zn finger protein HypA/HybF involved in hydrogenase expression